MNTVPMPMPMPLPVHRPRPMRARLLAAVAGAAVLAGATTAVVVSRDADTPAAVVSPAEFTVAQGGIELIPGLETFAAANFGLGSVARESLADYLDGRALGADASAACGQPGMGTTHEGAVDHLDGRALEGSSPSATSC